MFFTGDGLKVRQKSSTWRELTCKAIQLALDSFAGQFRGHHVLWHTDNQNCVQIVQKGNTKTHLKSLEFAIFSKCITVWISRNQDTKADYISNIIDYDDWQTTHGFF